MNLLIVVPLIFVPRLGLQLAMCNLMLGIINLLPLPNSDGQRILRNLSGSMIVRDTNPALSSVQSR
jgi:Zn-dependent protease